MRLFLSRKQCLLHGHSGKGPRTLAEELRDIGEEFIEFLEQGLQALEGSAPKGRQRAPGSSTADSTSSSTAGSTSASSNAGSTARCEALCPSVFLLQFVCDFVDQGHFSTQLHLQEYPGDCRSTSSPGCRGGSPTGKAGAASSSAEKDIC